jgi:hypothetical protein
MCKKANERLSNHREGPLERHVDRGHSGRLFRTPSISVLRVDGRIARCHGTRERILSESTLTKRESHLQFSGVRWAVMTLVSPSVSEMMIDQRSSCEIGWIWKISWKLNFNIINWMIFWRRCWIESIDNHNDRLNR